ncbi:MAG: PAC2 family protein [Thermoplasmata archaeon]
MAGTVSIVDTRGDPLTGAMMVVGFPTHGLVGSVAASYLVHTLDMHPVAYLVGEDLPPTVVMDEGTVGAPIRFFASKTVCGPDRVCDQLVVAISDIQPPPELLLRIGAALLDWAEGQKIHMVVAIEGQPVEGETRGDARVVALANRAARPLLDRYGFLPASGVMTGFAGGIMLPAIARSFPVLCLIAQAHKDYPDARAAAKVIETINPLVPLLVLNTRPLREKAREIEAQVRQALAEQQRAMAQMRPAPPEGSGEMYR